MDARTVRVLDQRAAGLVKGLDSVRDTDGLTALAGLHH